MNNQSNQEIWWAKYNEYMRSFDWREKRDAVILRESGICEECKSAKIAHIHHLTYERMGDENLEDLQGLCFECHQTKHPDKKLKIEKEWKTLQEIAKIYGVKRNAIVETLVARRWIEKERRVVSCGIRISSGKEIPTRKISSPSEASDEARKANVAKSQRNTKGMKTKTWLWDLKIVGPILDSMGFSRK